MEQGITDPTQDKLAAELELALQAMIARDRKDAYVPQPVRLSVKNDSLRFTTKGSDVPLLKLESVTVHIVGAIKARQYYANKEDKAPACYSADGNHTGTRHAELGVDIGIKNGQDCKSCPFAQFGSARNDAGMQEAGQACSEKRKLIVLTDKFNEPVIVSVPTMSVKNFDTYASGLNKMPAPKGSPLSVMHYNTVTTKISAVEITDKSNRQYGTMTFELVDILPLKAVAQGMLVAKENQELLGATAAENDAPAKDTPAEGTEDFPF